MNTIYVMWEIWKDCKILPYLESLAENFSTSLKNYQNYYKCGQMNWCSIDKVQKKYYTALEFRRPNFPGKQGPEGKNRTPVRVVFSLLLISFDGGAWMLQTFL